MISRHPEQVERRALLGRREHFLGFISLIDTPHPRAALQPVFNLFIQRILFVQKVSESEIFLRSVGWTSY